jgi:hypothetical protein
MSEWAAAMALAQLRKLPDIRAAMRRAKARLKEAFAGEAGVAMRRIICADGDNGSFLILTLDSETQTIALAQTMREEGVVDAFGAGIVPAMRDWGLHWCSNIPGDGHRRHPLCVRQSEETDPCVAFDRKSARHCPCKRGARPCCSRASPSTMRRRSLSFSFRSRYSSRSRV